MTMLQTLDTDLQRSVGKLALEIAANGAVVRRREEGCAKLRMPTRLRARHLKQSSSIRLVDWLAVTVSKLMCRPQAIFA